MSGVGIVIAGAGPCGIGAAWTLQRELPNRPFMVVDEGRCCGGYAASETTPEGFTFDLGGHVLFPHQHYVEFGEILHDLVKDWNHSCPVRGIYMHGRMIPSPVQRNVHKLPASESVPILLNLLGERLTRKRRPKKALSAAEGEESLLDYLNDCFGKRLTRKVMEPLNQKMWALHPSKMSSVWVRHRSGSQQENVPQISLRRLIKHALLGTEDPQWTGATRVSYPATGGTGSIWSRVLHQVGTEHLRFGRRITAIQTSEKRLQLSDGTELPYSHLISTIPLDVLLGICVDTPHLQNLARGLRRSSAVLLGFGIKGAIPGRFRGLHSFHCPEGHLPFWRVTIPSNLAPGNVPDAQQYYSVLCEVSCQQDERLDVDRHWRQAVVKGLQGVGLLIDVGQICSRFEKVLPHGYPLPFLGRDKLLAAIHRQLEPLGILSRGRFGGWRYEVSNQDHAFMQGVEAVRYLLHGNPEITYEKRWA
jgi:protoporphyrinogen oxidase